MVLGAARRAVGVAAALLALLWVVVLPALALDDAVIASAEVEARTLQAELRRYTALPRNPAMTEADIDRERAALNDIQQRALIESDDIDTPIAEVSTQLDQLGPAPTDGATEASSIVQKRSTLINQLARLNALQKQHGLIAIEAQQAQTRLTVLQRERFFQRVFESGPSILDPRLWVDTAKGSVQFVSRLQNLATSGWRRAQARINWYPAAIFPLGLALIWLIGNRLLPLLVRSFGFVAPQTQEIASENALLRLWRVVWGSARLAVSVFLALVFFVVALQSMGLFGNEIETLVDFLISSVSAAIILGGFAYLVCAPFHPQRRLVAIDDRAARSIPVIVGIASLVSFLGDEVSSLSSEFNLPVSFSIGQSALTSLVLIVLIGLLFVIVKRQATKNLASEGQAFFLVWFLKFMPLLWLLLAVAALALVSGYIALSYFIAGNLLTTTLIVVAFGVLHAFVDALAGSLADANSRPGFLIRKATGFSEQGIRRLVLFVRTLADALLVLAAALLLLTLWTVVLFELKDVFSVVGRGLQIGNISLSFSTLAIALAVLAVGIFLTRIVTRWLNNRVLSETQLDRGVQNSIQSAAGYAGYTLAAAMALSAAGLDFSSIAIVAGALGVGIGFGLQSIVNNFVSGLILLAERPVRVGDWIVTQAGEGIVKKINVRATEIETFDNGTIVVPNSNLITNAVKNWTLRDSTGRFSVSFNMIHGVDPEDVIDKLEAIARAHPKVMRHPAASAKLAKILPNGLEFEVGGQVRDVLEADAIASTVRLEIVKAFDKKLLMVQPKPAEAK